MNFASKNAKNVFVLLLTVSLVRYQRSSSQSLVALERTWGYIDSRAYITGAPRIKRISVVDNCSPGSSIINKIVDIHTIRKNNTNLVSMLYLLFTLDPFFAQGRAGLQKSFSTQKKLNVKKVCLQNLLF